MGSLLEQTRRGDEPLESPDGESRKFLREGMSDTAWTVRARGLSAHWFRRMPRPCNSGRLNLNARLSIEKF